MAAVTWLGLAQGLGPSIIKEFTLVTVVMLFAIIKRDFYSSHAEKGPRPSDSGPVTGRTGTCP